MAKHTRKLAEWKTVARAVNAVGSENRTMAESKKKWSDVKFKSKKRVKAHGNSML